MRARTKSERSSRVQGSVSVIYSVLAHEPSLRFESRHGRGDRHGEGEETRSAWSDSGGGVSQVFGRPGFQAGCGVPGRALWRSACVLPSTQVSFHPACVPLAGTRASTADKRVTRACMVTAFGNSLLHVQATGARLPVHGPEHRAARSRIGSIEPAPRAVGRVGPSNRPGRRVQGGVRARLRALPVTGMSIQRLAPRAR